jgi:DNA-binding NarL/FixJ family response regulator
MADKVSGAVSRAHTLTSRERAVFQLLGAGHDNRSIARELEISERTVKRYVTAILTKLGLESRLQAGLAALVISFSTADGAYCPEGLIEISRQRE